MYSLTAGQVRKKILRDHVVVSAAIFVIRFPNQNIFSVKHLTIRTKEIITVCLLFTSYWCNDLWFLSGSGR
jgi:hypothetical protein